jgi:hypothetical protein
MGSIDLAVSLVRSLFCGLPRQDKRMAVFLCASDESDGGHHRSRFWHGGWVGPETDWYNYFAPAWQERVLDATPKIPYLHVTEIRDHNWRKEHGVSWLQAQDKLDEAALLLDQMGSLYPITISANAGAFLDAHGHKKVIKNEGDKKPSRFLVDHYSFNAYIFAVLSYIYFQHPDAEKVDFMVERKDGVWEKLEKFYEGLAFGLDHIGKPELKKYMGDFIPVGKERVPVQMADMLCWHVSRDELDLLKGRDAMRAATIFNRKGKRIDLPDELHGQMARSFAEKMNESKDTVPKVRRDNAGSNERAAQRDKGRTGRGKARKAAEEKAES